MKLGTVTQQPAERLSYTVDYGEFLTDGDNVSTANATADSPDLTVDSVAIFDPRVRFWVSGGVAGQRYKVTIDVTTAEGREMQDEIIFKIKEY